MKRSNSVREIIETIVLALLIFFAIHFTVQTYHVEGPSMIPSLSTDEYVIVNKVGYFFQPPQRGDVIVFHYPYSNNPPQDFIKRIIGLPGDTIRIDATHVWVNGVLLKEPYISRANNPQTKPEWKVPDNSYFVMGDNRPVSDDSRYWGFVPKNDIVGKAMIVYWPMPSWQIINTYPTVYAQIHH